MFWERSCAKGRAAFGQLVGDVGDLMCEFVEGGDAVSLNFERGSARFGCLEVAGCAVFCVTELFCECRRRAGLGSVQARGRCGISGSSIGVGPRFVREPTQSPCRVSGSVCGVPARFIASDRGLLLEGYYSCRTCLEGSAGWFHPFSRVSSFAVACGPLLLLMRGLPAFRAPRSRVPRRQFCRVPPRSRLLAGRAPARFASVFLRCRLA